MEARTTQKIQRDFSPDPPLHTYSKTDARASYAPPRHDPLPTNQPPSPRDYWKGPSFFMRTGLFQPTQHLSLPRTPLSTIFLPWSGRIRTVLQSHNPAAWPELANILTTATHHLQLTILPPAVLLIKDPRFYPSTGGLRQSNPTYYRF